MSTEVATEDMAKRKVPHLACQDRLGKQDLIALWDRIRNKGKRNRQQFCFSSF